MAGAGHDGEAQALDQAQLREITQTILALPGQVRECFCRHATPANRARVSGPWDKRTP